MKKETKKKIPKKKKKKQTATSSLPVPSHHKSKVRSPRIVLRENVVRKPKQQESSYIIFRDNDKMDQRNSNAERSGAMVAKPRHDSNSSSSHDDRVVIGGGLAFSWPKQRPSKKKTKLTSSKIGKVKSCKPPKSTTSKAKQQKEPIPEIVEGNNQKIAELQFFENISQIEQNSKTLEEELREISRMQARERQIENTALYSNHQGNPYAIRDLPPRAVPQPALAPSSSPYGINKEEPRNIYLPQETVTMWRCGNTNGDPSAPILKPINGGTLDASNLSEKELIELITQEIKQQEKKNASSNKSRLAEEVPPTLSSCGFNGKKTNTLLPHENNRERQTPVQNGNVGVSEQEDDQEDGVLGVRNLTREERSNKKNLEERMKKSTVIATPIIRSGQISALEERTLRQRFDNANLMPNNKNATYTFSPDTTTNSHLIKLPRRSKDDSYDSFEHHERYFGIIDEQGEARNNEQLLDASYSNKKHQKKLRQKQRKNERLQMDLETARHPRRFSCPGSLGTREGFSFSDDAYNSDANTIDSIDETKAR